MDKMRFYMCTSISGSSQRNDNNHFEMWIASLVVACVSCMCNVSFVKINKNLDGIFDHIASQSMYNWDSHQLSMIILLGLKPCIRFLGKGNTNYSNFNHVPKKTLFPKFQLYGCELEHHIFLL
jgi:hypothetical protein